MGITRFATLSDGTFLMPLNSFKRHENALRKAQQTMRAAKPSSVSTGRKRKPVSRVSIPVSAILPWLSSVKRVACPDISSLRTPPHTRRRNTRPYGYAGVVAFLRSSIIFSLWLLMDSRLIEGDGGP